MKFFFVGFLLCVTFIISVMIYKGPSGFTKSTPDNSMLRDYQIQVHMDTVWIYDRTRLVDKYVSNWRSQIDSVILKDNL